MKDELFSDEEFREIEGIEEDFDDFSEEDEWNVDVEVCFIIYLI